MKLFNRLVFITLVSVLYGCTNTNQKDNFGNGVITVDFKDPQNIKSSDIITKHTYIKLETSDSSLFGSVNQIEILNDRIYILDKNKTNSIFIFSIQGEFIKRLGANGNGPGEFIAPQSFKIDPKGYIYVLDRVLNRLLKYQLSDLSFIEEIILPFPSPLSFSIINSDDLFIYYYPIRKNSDLDKKQLVIADKTGRIIKTLYEGSSSGKILHGNPTNIYTYKKETRVYPYFTNKIYKIENDSMTNCYNLFWGKYTMPDERLFDKHENSGDIMNEISTGEKDWIRLLYVYETDDILLVKYYIKKDFYLSYWNKHTKKIVNTKAKSIIDDLGLGGTFPLPIGIHKEQMIGIINPFEVDIKQVKDKDLLSLLENMTEESNPLIIIYSLK